MSSGDPPVCPEPRGNAKSGSLDVNAPGAGVEVQRTRPWWGTWTPSKPTSNTLAQALPRRGSTGEGAGAEEASTETLANALGEVMAEMERCKPTKRLRKLLGALDEQVRGEHARLTADNADLRDAGHVLMQARDLAVEELRARVKGAMSLRDHNADAGARLMRMREEFEDAAGALTREFADAAAEGVLVVKTLTDEAGGLLEAVGREQERCALAASEATGLLDTNRALEVEVSSLKQERDALTASLHLSEQEAASLSDARDALTTSLRLCDEEVTSLKQERDALTANLRLSEQEAASLKQERDALTAGLRLSEEKAASLKHEGDALAASLDQAEEESAHLREDLVSDLLVSEAALEQALSALESHVHARDALASDLRASAQESASLRDAHDVLAASLRVSEQESASLRDANDALAASLRLSEKKAASCSDARVALACDLRVCEAALEKALSALESQKGSRDALASALRVSEAALEKALCALETQVGSMEHFCGGELVRAFGGVRGRLGESEERVGRLAGVCGGLEGRLRESVRYAEEQRRACAKMKRLLLECVTRPLSSFANAERHTQASDDPSPHPEEGCTTPTSPCSPVKSGGKGGGGSAKALSRISLLLGEKWERDGRVERFLHEAETNLSPALSPPHVAQPSAHEGPFSKDHVHADISKNPPLPAESPVGCDTHG